MFFESAPVRVESVALSRCEDVYVPQSPIVYFRDKIDTHE